MATSLANINPQNLIWARQRAGYSIDMLAKKLGVMEEKLKAWESGSKKPTFRQAQQFADKTLIPFGYLFLPMTPVEKLAIPDLRTLNSNPIDRPSAELFKIIEIVLARQHWYKEHNLQQGVEQNAYVGRCSVHQDCELIVNDMRFVLQLTPHPDRGKWEDYYRDLIKRIEALDILIMRQAHLGHYSRPLSVNEFRGFAISDPVAPVIFINDADSPKARLFTLIHELCHIWIGVSGISDANPNTHREEERLCNAVAAEFLVPANEMLSLWQAQIPWQKNLAPLEAHFHVSTWVLARRALTLGLIAIEEYRGYIALLKKEHDNREKDGQGPTYYTTLKSQTSGNFARALLSEALSGRVLLRDAGALLGVKPDKLKTFAKGYEI